MGEWTPCSKTQPKEEGLYIVTLKNGEIALDCHTRGWVNDGWVTYDNVVAWMPLPEPFLLI